MALQGTAHTFLRSVSVLGFDRHGTLVLFADGDVQATHHLVFLQPMIFPAWRRNISKSVYSYTCARYNVIWSSWAMIEAERRPRCMKWVMIRAKSAFRLGL